MPSPVVGPDRLEVDFLTVGQVTRDRTLAGDRLGGAVSFAALLARRLGRRPAIVTSAGPDADLSSLAGIPLHSVPADATTCFENVYGPAGRRQRLLARAAPLSSDDVPAAWWGADVVFLAPVAGEIITPFVIPPGRSVVGLGLQGWLRTWDETGRVRSAFWPDPDDQVGRADFVFVSEEDLGRNSTSLDFYTARARCLIVTRGPVGCRIVRSGQVLEVPAGPAREVDPTGAGDVFAAAFLIRWQETRNLEEAARFAQAAAAIAIEGSGASSLPSRSDVLRRLAQAGQHGSAKSNLPESADPGRFSP